MEATRYRTWSHARSQEARHFGLSADLRRPWTIQSIYRLAISSKSYEGNGPDWSGRGDQSSPATALSGLPPIPPVHRVGTCVQVPHQTFLDMGPTSDRFWTLVTHTLVPGPDRRDMAILLACLESVYRAEYQQLAGEAITAIAAANNAHVRPDGTVAEPPSETDIVLGSTTQDQQDGEQQRQQQWEDLKRDMKGDLPMVAAATAALARSYGIRSGASKATGGLDQSSFDDMDAAADGRAGTVGRDGDNGAVASELDARVLRQLLRLAQRAGYRPFTVRDVRLADSLNTDYLSQLFIKGSTRRVDGALVQDYVDPSLPAEARPVLLLQRGYGRELQAGRLLLQKLDYLQTLAVGQAGSLAGGAAAVLAAVLFGTFEEGGPGAAPFFVDSLTNVDAAIEARMERTSAGTSGLSAVVGTAAAGGAGPQEGLNSGVRSEDNGTGEVDGVAGLGRAPIAAAGKTGSIGDFLLSSDYEGEAMDAAQFTNERELNPDRPESTSNMAVTAMTVRDATEAPGPGAITTGATAAAVAAVAVVQVQRLAQRQQDQRLRPHEALDSEERNQFLQSHETQLDVLEGQQMSQQDFLLLEERGVVQHRRADAQPAVGTASGSVSAWEAKRSSAPWTLPTRAGRSGGTAAVEGPATEGPAAEAAAAAPTTATSRDTGLFEVTATVTTMGEAMVGTPMALTTPHSKSWVSFPPQSVPDKAGCNLSSNSAADSVGPAESCVESNRENTCSSSRGTCNGSSNKNESSSSRSGSNASAERSNAEGSAGCADKNCRPLTQLNVGGEQVAPGGIGHPVSGRWAAADGAEKLSQLPGLTLGEAESTPPSPLATALSGMYSALSDWGLVPRTDVIPLSSFNSHFPVHERPGRQPLYICKVSLGDALGGADWLRSGLRNLLDGLLREVQLQEPTFREVLVLYRPAHARMAPALERSAPMLPSSQRRVPNRGSGARRQRPQGGRAEEQQQNDSYASGDSDGEASRGRKDGMGSSRDLKRQRPIKQGLGSGWLRRLWAGWRGAEKEQAVRRPPIQIRIYRDIPVPTWKVVLPEKLLQFRPLDLLRVDLFALAGLTGLLAQARYDNIVVNVITFGSAAVLLVRIILGYQRMADRFRSVVNELLAEKALAGQEGAVEALAMAAAQQQLRQAALAYVLLLHHCRPGGVHELQMQQPAAQDLNEGAVVATGADSAAVGAPAMATTAQLQELAEWALAHHSGVRVRFNACEALHELHRLGLVVRVADGESDREGSSDGGEGCNVDDIANEDGTRSSAVSASPSALSGGRAVVVGAVDGQGTGVVDREEGSSSDDAVHQSNYGCGDLSLECDGPDGCRYADVWWAAVPLRDAVPVVEDHWAGLLWRRVGAILRRRDGL